MLFKDRFDAAVKLLPCMKNYSTEDSVIYAVPGGGVPLGYYLAKNYNFPMELVHTKKISHPKKSDVTVGAVNLQDHVVDESLNISSNYIKDEVLRIRQTLQEYAKKFSTSLKPASSKNKVFIVVDDGASTGNTLLAAIRQLRQFNPRKIVVALPVASVHALEKLRAAADEIVCLHTLDNVIGVSNNYLNYSKLSDQEIFQLLSASNRAMTAA